MDAQARAPPPADQHGRPQLLGNSSAAFVPIPCDRGPYTSIVIRQQESSPRARFGPFEVDLRAGELKESGRRVRLPGKPFDVLVALLERDGEVVLREELYKRLWPDKSYFDFDNNLNSAVATLREALGDSADEPQYVETLTKRGYRLLVAVQWDGEAGNGNAPRPTRERSEAGRARDELGIPTTGEAAPAPSVRGVSRTRRWLLAAGLVAAALAASWLLRDGSGPGRRLAVLPFEDISPGTPAVPYFAAGVTEDLIATLGASLPPHFEVIGSTSTRRYEATRRVPLARAGAELRADLFLQGTVRRERDRVRLSAQLLEADGTVAWATSFDEPLQRILSAQSSIAARVADTLAVDLAPRRTSTVDPTAYEALQRGRYLLRSGRPEALAEARLEIERALEVDPSYSAAWVALAEAWSASGLPPRVWAPHAANAVARALALDPHRADAHLQRAHLAVYFDYDWRQAERSLAEAARLNPGSRAVHQARAEFFSITGRHDVARAAMLRARSLDPVAATVTADAGWYEFVARRYRHSLEASAAALELEPRHPGAHLYRFLAHEALGEWEAARRAAAAYQQLRGADPPAIAAVAGPADPRAGLLAFHRWNLARHRAEARREYRSPAVIALDHLALDDLDAALDDLEQAYLERSGWLLPFLRVYPPLDKLRGHPRFQRLERRLGLADYPAVTGVR
jgi:DNA-binding winged helix-turn-helix (wHTH) protein/TolB-like protein